MNFIKGMIVGGAISMGMAFIYKETMTRDGRKMIRRGKKMVKRIAKDCDLM